MANPWMEGKAMSILDGMVESNPIDSKVVIGVDTCKDGSA